MKKCCPRFSGYSGKFEAIRETCQCGGSFDRVKLEKSDRDQLVLVCSEPTCLGITFAKRIKPGRAYIGPIRGRLMMA